MARLNDHIVICNWGDDAADLVRALHSDMFIQNNNQRDWRPIVVVAEGVKEFPDEPPFRGTMLLPGAPTKARMLERANIMDAHAVVVMADENASDPDDRTIMAAISINSVLKTAEAQGVGAVRRPRIIIEMINPDRAQLFKTEGLALVDEVVCHADLNIQAVAQSNISRGLTHVLRELLVFSDDTDEFYMIEVPENWAGLEVAKQGFFSVVRWIGERSREREANGDTPTTLLVGFVRLEGDRRRMIVNPKEKEYENLKRIQVGDSLILIARRREVALRVLDFEGVGSEEAPKAREASA